MKNPRYEYKTDDRLLLYEFSSEGPKGFVKKIVEYSATNVENVYNIAFGDLNEATGEIDDSCITNNGDSQIVLATVASTVYAFTDHYPDSWIYATGSTDARNRLYRMGIANNLKNISADFIIYGLRNEQWEAFSQGIEYTAFSVTRKTHKFVG